MSAAFDFKCYRDDPLGVLTSTAEIAANAEWLRLDADAVQAFARTHAAFPAPLHEEDALHCTFLEPRQFCNYLLALEALNFCFWDQEPRWRVEYQGATHDGYWALAAALHRAVTVDELHLWDAEVLAALDLEQVAHMLRGPGRPPPLLKERSAHLREAGQVLLARWGGQFANLIEAAGHDASTMVRRITEDFPSFRDVALWRGRELRFYKRAQICVADLARMLPGEELGSQGLGSQGLGSQGLGRIEGLHTLTAFADYKVPQVMRKEGIIVLTPGLAERIDRGEELAPGGEEELELRAATIWGCEWIARALAEHGGCAETAPSAAEVDYLLWSAGQKKQGLPPYHRTRTIYY